MNNMPEVKIGIVAVSRDCFPESLSVNRRKALVQAYQEKYDAKNIYECPICIVERLQSRANISDTDNGKALQETIDDLRMLLDAYRSGSIKENSI